MDAIFEGLATRISSNAKLRKVHRDGKYMAGSWEEFGWTEIEMFPLPLKSRQDNSCIGADLTSDYSRSSGESEPDSFHSLSDTESEYEDKGSFRRSSLRMNSPDEESDRDPRGVNQIWRKMGAPSKRSPESAEDGDKRFISDHLTAYPSLFRSAIESHMKHTGPPSPSLSPLRQCLISVVKELQVRSDKPPPAAKPSKGCSCRTREQAYLPGVLYHIYEEIPTSIDRPKIHSTQRQPRIQPPQRQVHRTVNGGLLQQANGQPTPKKTITDDSPVSIRTCQPKPPIKALGDSHFKGGVSRRATKL